MRGNEFKSPSSVEFKSTSSVFIKPFANLENFSKGYVIKEKTTVYVIIGSCENNLKSLSIN